MAEASTHTTPELSCHQTALAIIPPAHLVDHANTLRAAYDKAFHKWPAHVNLVYPFVHPESLSTASSLVRSAVGKASLRGDRLKLNDTGCFTHKHSSTIYMRPGHDEDLQELRRALLVEFGQQPTGFSPHLTIGQAGNDELRDSLHAKARLLPAIGWPLKELALLVRGEDNVMRVWSTIEIPTDGDEGDETARASPQLKAEPSSKTANVQKGTTYRFDSSAVSWIPSSTSGTLQTAPPSFTVSSYNVLVDSIFPPAYERFGILVRALVSDAGRSDLVVLQEVSDEFLSHLLRNDEVRELWPYVSHAPPDQEEIGPLLSLRNIVVLSRWSFDWEMVAFERRHKGSVVVRLGHIGKLVPSGTFRPLVVAGLHLTCGLTDGSVAAKKSQLRTLVSHLAGKYPESPWIVAGDFNMTTSARTIDDALKTLSISSQTARTLQGLEQLLSEAGLADTWAVAQSHGGSFDSGVEDDDVAEGERGATFDPRTNPLAAEIVGHGLTHRPQRYDRILLKGEEAMEVASFNMFGHPDSDEQRCGSDHWGVRATVKLTKSPTLGDAAIQGIPAVDPPPSLDPAALQTFIARHPAFPTVDDTHRRQQAFVLLETTLQQLSTVGSKIPLVVVPVGSYGLGAWNTASDIDCLCISSISSKTFFTLAVKHLRKAVAQGARILRKVEAHSGTMLELDVQGVKFDLQYCAAGRIAVAWPAPLSLLATDPLFSLPLQTLSKLKAIRDLAHLLQTTPDLSAFRIAYRFLVIWAVSRGTYAARFGFLSGTHISLLLDRVAKLLHHHRRDDNEAITAAHLVCTFFRYYADFDWGREVVEDPLTRSTPGMGRAYHRHAGEPMVVLGYHVPRANVARAASAPAVSVLVEEFRRADSLVAKSGVTWASIVGENGHGAAEFLAAYKSYVRVDVQYWGASPVKGRQLIGWIESRCPVLLVDLHRKTPEIYARMWPMRFTRNEHSGDDKGDQHGCYLIGLAKRTDVESSAKTEADRKLAQNKLDGALERFSEQIRGNESFFDPASAWIDVKHVSQSKLEHLIVDGKDWGDNADLEDGLEFEDDEEEEISDMSAPEDDAEAQTPSASEAKGKGRASASKAAFPVSGRKLRPATDILNRLRWDPNLNSLDYVVGYTDRFLGTRETPLDRWKLEQTDEEFIPQHRILYFKRRSDGVRVWDREARIDALFGSGG